MRINQLMQKNLSIVVALIFAIVMSLFVTLKTLTMSYPNFDLGISYRTMVLFLRFHIILMPNNLNVLTTPKPYSKLIYIVLSPTLFIYNSPITVVIDQVIFISVGGYAVFKIFEHITKDNFSSIFMEIVYFLYYPLYGFLSNGGNFMVIFGPLLLVSYFFYIAKRQSLWVLFSILASLSNTLAPFLVLLVYFIIIPLEEKNKLEKIKTIIEKIQKKEKINHSNAVSNLILLFSLFVIITFLFSKYGILGLFSGENINISALVAGQGIYHNLLPILENVTINDWQIYLRRIYEFLIPLLLIPLSNLFIIVFFFYIILGNYTGKTFFTSPNDHYTSMLVPFLFIGISRTFSKINRKKIRKIAFVILVLNVVFFAVYSPFGLNENNWSGSQNASNVISEVSLNKAEMMSNSVFNLIQANSSLFLDAHAPQLYGVSELFSMSSGGRRGACLVSPYNNETLNYVVLYPIPINSFYGQWSMYNSFWSNYFLHNNSYGVYSSINGDLVLKNGYKGVPLFYLPFKFDYSTPVLTGFVNYKNVTNLEHFITAGYVLTPPGQFIVNVTFTIAGKYLNNNTNMTINSYREFVKFGSTQIIHRTEANDSVVFTLESTFTSEGYGHINVFLNLNNINGNNIELKSVTTIMRQSEVCNT